MAAGRLFLIDSYGFIFRAYHARARTGAPPMRTSTGLSTEAVYIFHNMLRKLRASFHPEYVAAVFEGGPSFRDKEFAEYKANRTEMPPDLREQIPYIRRTVEAMRVPILEYEGFEADDVIGTIARRASEQGIDVVIVSSDKDMLQLVDDRVSMFNPVKEDVWYDPKTVTEFMGVAPGQVADLLALKGDSIDNIPGAPGIGDKGARDLILKFGSLEAALERAAEVERRTYRESLQNHREQILLSKRLSTIATAVPIEWNLESMKTCEPDLEALRRLYKEAEFFSLLKELEPAPSVSAPRDYATIESADELKKWLVGADGKPIAVSMGSTGEGLLATTTFGLSYQEGHARAVSIDLIEGLRPLLEDPDRPKIAHDLNGLLCDLAARGVEARGFLRDVMIEAFLTTADVGGCSLEALSQRMLDCKLGGGAEHHADVIITVAGRLGPQMEAQGLRELYETIELPLAPVLARMKRTGIRVEPAALVKLSESMEREIDRLTLEIHGLAGKPFNINSPQQLGKILFDDLRLPQPVKYGKGKTTSTAADVLEELADENEIARKVLDYRQLTKLKGTYVDALPGLIDPDTGRLHTTLNQAGAATGRLSSSNPNLQNIPIRTELGRQIRAAFVPRKGWKLIVADYSQIELRLLAHMSHDALLMDSFSKGEDIHTRTAAEVFGVSASAVNPELRRRAKAVNFGIVYGQTPFGLSMTLGISRQEADTYIKRYFERYAGVKTFIESTIAEVKKTGVVRTMFGRLRPIPDLGSRNPSARGFAERTAVNTPLQGTAADLIKLAMVRIDAELSRRRMQTAMLLQVHDELIFESPPDELDDARGLVKDLMENAHRLDVPLVVDVGVGDNWRDAK